MKTEVLKNFIVLEGLDGSGTTTQLERVCKSLKNSYKTFEPTDSPIGKLIRSVLRKEVTLDPVTTGKLYAADRHEHIYGKDGVIEQVKKGKVVICDRYFFSSLAYQSPQCGYEFVKGINSEFPLPEYLIYLRVDVDTCQERINSRGEAKELFDASEYQREVSRFYDKGIDDFSNSGTKVVIIDGTKSPEEITNIILDTIR